MSFKSRFAKLPPLAKIGIWMAVVVVLASLVQLIAWCLGLPFSIVSAGRGGRGVLIALALAALLGVIAADRRPASDFGLFVGPQWKKLWFGGLAIGVATYTVYVIVALLLGAYVFRFDLFTPSRSAKAALAGLTALPLAVTQQILFSGYLLGILRDRYQRLTAVLIPALLFAVVGRLDNPAALLQSRTLPLLIGLFMVAVVLGIVRLRSGSILLPAGLLGGWMLVRRVISKSAIIGPDVHSPYFAWLVPSSDTRQAPMIWLILLLVACVAWWRLHRRGEGTVSATQAVDADFKRVFPLSHGSNLAPLDLWLGRLISARFRIGAVYWPRLLAILIISTANTLLSLPERLLLPLLLRRRRVKDPMFVVGVHRSGTTHLHNLLALDPQFCTPRAYHILNPVGFLFSGWLIAPIAGAFMPWKRPMDSVRFHLFAPQEEEFVMVGVTRYSPLWGMTFPKQWPDYDRYISIGDLPPREQATWKRHYLLFLRKLTFWSRKRPVLKSPYNTARVKTLSEMFPQARFVHIYRHPFAVYRSNMHIAREAHVLNQLQDPDKETSYEARFLENYQSMEDAFYRDTRNSPPGTVAEVAFEQLEQEPVAEIERIYAELGLDFTPQYRARLERYLDGLADYQKTRHKALPEFERRRIATVMRKFLVRWGYEQEARPQRRAA